MNSENQETYNKLIEELKQNREEMAEMLDAAVSFRKQVNQIIPPSTDFKKKWLVDEKMKLVVSVFGIELDIRKQRESSLKTEIELRRKISGEEMTKAEEVMWRDASTLAKALEMVEGKKHPQYHDEIPMDTDDSEQFI